MNEIMSLVAKTVISRSCLEDPTSYRWQVTLAKSGKCHALKQYLGVTLAQVAGTVNLHKYLCEKQYH